MNSVVEKMDMDLKQVTVRLNFHNYDLWKQRTKQILIREGLWRVVADNPPAVDERSDAWVDKDERAAATIGYLVENSQLQLIKNANTAQETWNVLRDYHVRQSSAGKVGLVKRLCRLEMEENGNVEEHIIEMDSLFDKLAEVGCEISEEMKCSFIMASLPESYDSFVTMVEGFAGKFSEKTVKAKLLNEFYKRQHKVSVQEEKAMKAAVPRGRKPFGLESDRREERRVCFECGKPGHIRQNCYIYLSRLAEEQGVHRESPVDKNNAKIATQKEENQSRSVCFSAMEELCGGGGWIVDSGASHHMTADRSFFDRFQYKDSKLCLADGKEMDVVGVGEGHFTGFDNDGNVVDVKLTNVLFVPGLQHSLISVKRIVESGARVEFTAEKCCILNADKIVLIANVVSEVYRL